MRSKNGLLLIIICILLAIIAGMYWYQKTPPAVAVVHQPPVIVPSKPKPSTVPAPEASSTEPLSTRVSVVSPRPNATVGQSFTVTGSAPGNWYFEAVFPIQVRDPDDNLIATGQGRAQSDWMVTSQVAFKSTITLSKKYSGPASLILLRDNPSGLPENADLVTIPIVIR